MGIGRIYIGALVGDLSAVLSASPLFGVAPLDVTVNATIIPGQGQNITWVLDFGDGTQEEGEGTEVPEFVHQYSELNTYTITITVDDDQQGHAEDQVQIEVTQGFEVHLSVSPQYGEAPLNVTVNATIILPTIIPPPSQP